MENCFLSCSYKRSFFLSAILLFGFLVVIRPSFGFDDGVFGEMKFDIDSYSLQISKTGNGTVTSLQVGINCGSDCTEIYDEDTTVTLTATPSTGSGFSGWSGDCSGLNQQTTLLLDEDKDCTATFNSVAPTVAYVNRADSTCGGKSPCYTSIQAAINPASTGTVIRIAQGTYSESIDLTTSKTLTLQGGWDSSFTAQTSNKTFIKAPKATKGSLTLQMVTIKP